nr:hypothetical protein CFP56_29919 [Quercus suber]
MSSANYRDQVEIAVALDFILLDSIIDKAKGMKAAAVILNGSWLLQRNSLYLACHRLVHRASDVDASIIVKIAAADFR